LVSLIIEEDRLLMTTQVMKSIKVVSITATAR